ncbi:uncharacterized protein METZ01_LOCUS362433 [marine metagenome]|uniref:Uncharacterized protein n=1 Tax=marine metagenome TaxID=408172 RepID=A0A382SI98_9ZZZZ
MFAGPRFGDAGGLYMLYDMLSARQHVAFLS